MLQVLFGGHNLEKTLLFLAVNDSAYAKELADLFGIPLYGIQRVLLKLETGGVLMSEWVGKTRLFRFDPDYPFLPELLALLRKVFKALPKETQQTYKQQKRRVSRAVQHK